MTPAHLLLVGVALLFVSGVPALVRRTPGGRRLATVTLALAALSLLGGAAWGLLDPAGAELAVAWSLPFGRFAIGLDPTSAVFLAPIALVPVLGAIYGHGYVEDDEEHFPGHTPERIRVFYGVLAGSLALLVLSRDAILFLLAWEGMALGSFFLITVDDRDPKNREAGWVYLVATHVGTLALFAMFALFSAARGDTTLAPLADGAITRGDATALFALGLVGFGLKAGLMPLHVWLPPAHAAAPSHVSAMLSGVVTKMGVYGLLRLVLLLPDPPVAWGTVLVAVGAISAVAALVFALGQGDVKRMLAYSTIENVGVIAIGLGLALIGRATHEGALVVLGLSGALLHVLAHAFMKTLLFLGAGALIHATGTRELDRMGGLLSRLPKTARLMVLGAVAICALPPLAGFASELVLYIGLFTGVGSGAPRFTALAAPALALTGALALAVFVRALGVALLGAPRSDAAARAHEAPTVMRAPMALAALVVVFLGLGSRLLAPLLDPIARTFARRATPALESLVPFDAVTIAGASLLAVMALVFWRLRRRVVATEHHAVPTWDCGYAAPTARMQYTASSFGTTLVSLFGWLARPTRQRPGLTAPFPTASKASERVPDVVLDRLVLPFGRRVEREAARLRVLQQGRLHVYILYMLLVVLGLYLGLGW